MFSCESCKYTTDKRGSYNRHCKTVYHLSMMCESTDGDSHMKNTNTVVAIVATDTFECAECRYVTSKQSNYHLHCKTARHRRLAVTTNHSCECGVSFHSNNALTFHRKQCIDVEPPEPPEPLPNPQQQPVVATAVPSPPTENMSSVVGLLATQNAQLMAQNNELVKLIHDRPVSTNNTTTNNKMNCNNTNTNNFNISLYLNNECAEAINLSDFMQRIQVQTCDLQMATVDGVAASVKAIMNREMGKLKLTERPIHCTDRKRKTLFVKEDGEWIKDESHCESIQQIIDMIGDKSQDRVRNWMNDCTDGDGKINNRHNQELLSSYAQTFWGNPLTDAARMKVINEMLSNVPLNGEIA